MNMLLILSLVTLWVIAFYVYTREPRLIKYYSKIHDPLDLILAWKRERHGSLGEKLIMDRMTKILSKFTSIYEFNWVLINADTGSKLKELIRKKAEEFELEKVK